MAIRYTGFNVVTKNTMLGYPFRVFEKEPAMPRIANRFLDCSIYLYPDSRSAQAADRTGGSGFLVGMSAREYWRIGGYCPAKDYYHLYAVSNRHVVETNPVVRLNTHDGRFDVLEFTPRDWIISPHDDLAVIPLDHQRAYSYLSINVVDFITKRTVTSYDIGLGDETFIIGRFISQEGIQRNSPSMRFGHISMMPFEPVHHQSNASGIQESFLVEIHSMSGYSGSPVFVRPFASPRIGVTHTATNTAISHFGLADATDKVSGGPWLLGVDWGHIQTTARTNTGLTGVIPAWCLQSLLDDERVKAARISEQTELRARTDRGATECDQPSA